MPIHGKKSRARARVSKLPPRREEGGIVDRILRPRDINHPLAEQVIEYVDGKRRVIDRRLFPIIDSSLLFIDSFIPVSLTLRKMIEEGIQDPLVVDWGCGEGIALEQLATEFDNARCYGYSHTFYGNWGDSKRVKYIHAPSGTLARYLPNDSVDLIYSFNGLSHLGEELPDEIRKLTPKLKDTGIILLEVMGEGALKKIEKDPGLVVSKRGGYLGDHAIFCHFHRRWCEIHKNIKG